MKIKLGNLDGPRKAQLARQADRIATDFESQRELDAVCMVVDMVRCGLFKGGWGLQEDITISGIRWRICPFCMRDEYIPPMPWG